ncbi:MAG TPA: hypothetical protein VGD60_05240 [Candidatus Acidoferrales bacterium]
MQHFPHLVILHIAGGLIGIAAGFVTMFLRKGSRRHGIAGDVFVVAMLCMSVPGAYMGWINHLHGVSGGQMANFFNGTLVAYLVCTGWVTARRSDSKISASPEIKAVIFDWLAWAAVSAIGLGMISYGLKAAHDLSGTFDGYPPGIYFFFGAMALLAATGDLRMLMRGSLEGVNRLVRHLWRMSFAFLIAVFSLFLGQQRVFPAAWRGSPLFYIPPAIALVLLIFWFIRVRFTAAYKRKSVNTAPAFQKATAI